MLVAFDKEPNDLFLQDFLLVADYVGPLEGPHPWSVHTLGGSAPLEGPHPWNRARSVAPLGTTQRSSHTFFYLKKM